MCDDVMYSSNSGEQNLPFAKHFLIVAIYNDSLYLLHCSYLQWFSLSITRSSFLFLIRYVRRWQTWLDVRFFLQHFMLSAMLLMLLAMQEATIIRKTRTGESRGFGFVTFRSTTDAQQVRLQEHSIGGRHCDAKQALPRGTANPSRETRLFVGRLPPSITDTELRDHFERFGKVQVGHHLPTNFYKGISIYYINCSGGV